jgi:pSer/pThr/pTyr-binding forkhead associated (FHA) protein
MEAKTVVMSSKGANFFLLDKRSGERHSLQAGNQIFGRETGFDDPGVSRKHFQITLTQSGAFIEDLRSANGTTVNGASLRAGERRLLAAGDVIEFGASQLCFGGEGAARPAVLVPLKAETPKPQAIVTVAPVNIGPMRPALAQQIQPAKTIDFEVVSPRNWDWATCVVAGLCSVASIFWLIGDLLHGSTPYPFYFFFVMHVFFVVIAGAAGISLQRWFSRRFPHNVVMSATIPLSFFAFFFVYAVFETAPGLNVHQKQQENYIVSTCRTDSSRACREKVEKYRRGFRRLSPELRQEIVARAKKGSELDRAAASAPLAESVGDNSEE